MVKRDLHSFSGIMFLSTLETYLIFESSHLGGQNKDDPWASCLFQKLVKAHQKMLSLGKYADLYPGYSQIYKVCSTWKGGGTGFLKDIQMKIFRK